MNRTPAASVYPMMEETKRNRAFTLVELTFVVALVAVVAAVATSRLGAVAREARLTAARADLAAIRDAFVGEGGYFSDLGGIPGFSPAAVRTAGLFIATNVWGCAVDSPGSGAPLRMVRLDEPGVTEARCRAERRALPEEFTVRDDARSRGWRGPYLSASRSGFFPAADERRRPGEPTAAERGFYPRLDGLGFPAEFSDRRRASAYGFPGEPVPLDPWGSPYVVQVPPRAAFPGAADVTDEERFRYARAVSAGPNGILETPCFDVDPAGRRATTWNERFRRLSRQAGLVDGEDFSARGDDLVLFFSRADVDEGRENP